MASPDEMLAAGWVVAAHAEVEAPMLAERDASRVLFMRGFSL